jgi:PhnB protein
MRLPDKDGLLMHAAVTINGSIVMLMDEYLKYGARSPKTIGGTPVVLHLMVPDVDAAIARAVGAGASIIMAASDMFWGDRYGQIEDPFGHRWSIATHQRDMSPDEIQAALKTMGG